MVTGPRARNVLYSLPFFALSMALGLATIWYQRYVVLRNSATLDGFASRLAMAGQVPWFYLSKALLPVDLTVIYRPFPLDHYAPGVLLVICFVVLLWKRGTWGRPLLFGFGYFVVTLFPVLGFFDQAFYSSTLVADHWQYHSIIGVIALLVGAGALVFRRLGERARYWETVASLVVVIALGWGTWRRGLVYATDETLWRDNVAKNPDASVAHNNLGVTLVCCP